MGWNRKNSIIIKEKQPAQQTTVPGAVLHFRKISNFTKSQTGFSIGQNHCIYGTLIMLSQFFQKINHIFYDFHLLLSVYLFL